MLKLVIFLFIFKVFSKDSNYCSKRVPPIDKKFDVCTEGKESDWTKENDSEDPPLETVDVVAKCKKYWADPVTDQEVGYTWAKGTKYRDDCENHKICCDMTEKQYQQRHSEEDGGGATDHLVIACVINKACNWIIPNLPWLLPVVIGVVALCLLSCIISCCCGCCSGSSGNNKKPKDDGSANAALAAQQQQLVALQAATSMALMAQQQQQMAAAGGAGAPAPAAAAAAPAAADPAAADPAPVADPDPFAAKPEYGSSDPAPDSSGFGGFDSTPETAPADPLPEPDYGGF